MALLSPLGPQFFKNDGTVAAGCRLYTFQSGTTTQQNAFTSQAGSTPHTYVSDGAGGTYIALDTAGKVQPALWLTAGVEYRIRLNDSTGALIDEWDDIYGVGDGSASLLSDTSSVSLGDALVGVKRTESGSVATTQHAVNEWRNLYPEDYGAVGDGTTNDATALQSLLTAARDGAGRVVLRPGKTYKCNSALTLQRSSSGHSKSLVIDGQGSTINFSSLSGSSIALTVGATGTSFFLEDGGIVIRDLTLVGPESADPRDTSASTTTTGLALTYAGGVTLENVRCFNFYKAYYSLWAFPVKAINCNFRRSWIGAHFDEVSNLQEWDGLTLPNCRYGILIRSESTALDSGKSNTLTFRRPWIEGTCVGMVIDTDAGVSGSGQIRHRGIQVIDPYLSSPAGSVNPSDFFRIGTRWTLANPTTRGANCSEICSDFTLTCNGGLINPSTGVFTSTQALVAFDSTNVRCRNFQLNAIATSVRIDADSIVNNPYSGWARTSGYPGVSDGIVEETWWDNSAIVRRLWPDGSLSIGSARTTQGSTTQAGAEITPAGVQYLVRSGGQVADWNRDGSDGTLATFRRSNTAVGSISVTTTATAFNTSSDYRLKQDVTPADQAKAVQAVLSWPLREFAFKVTPDVRQFGFLAHELQAVAPYAVTGEKDGEDMQSVDYSKLVPELVAAVQYLLERDKKWNS